MIPSNDSNNYQVGVDEVIDRTEQILTDKAWIDENWYDLKEPGSSVPSGYASAVNKLNDHARVAFSNTALTYKGELDDWLDDDDIEITYEIEILTVDKIGAAPDVQTFSNLTYNVSYRVKITILYDEDSFGFSGDRGTIQTFYTKAGRGVLTGSWRLDMESWI